MEEEGAAQPQDFQKNKKRKKKSFLQNARSFAKKQCFGRGTEVDQEIYNYFLNIISVIRSEENPQSIEEKVMLANNALEDHLPTIIHISSNQVCSRAVEGLIPFTESEAFEQISKAFLGDLRIASTDQYASHVLEKLVQISLFRCSSMQQELKDDEMKHNFESEWSEEHKTFCREFVEKTSKFMLNNLEDFVWDCYASHVIRKCIASLAGLILKPGQGKKEEFIKISVFDEWEGILKEFAERLQAWPQFNEMPYNEYTSGILQYLCLGLKQMDKNVLKSFGKKLLHESFLSKSEVEEKLPKVFESEPSIRLLEVLISVAGPKLMTQINANIFKGRLKLLATHKSANFAVQKFLLHVNDEFEGIFDEMIVLMDEILSLGYTGVLHAFAEACKRLKINQGQFIQALQKSLKCEKNPKISFFQCVTKLKPSDSHEHSTKFVHLHGSLICQAILNFNKPIKFVQNMLEVKADELLKIFTDPKGSHIVDAFFKSLTVGEQSKQKFIRHFSGYMVNFAVSKHGSQALEVLFNEAPQKSKMAILAELADNFNQLNGSPAGQIINKKLHVQVYKLNPKRWEASFNTEKSNKIQNMFKELVKD